MTYPVSSTVRARIAELGWTLHYSDALGKGVIVDQDQNEAHVTLELLEDPYVWELVVRDTLNRPRLEMPTDDPISDP